MQKIYLHTELVGCDISDAQYPVPRPPGIRLFLQDALTPFPPEHLAYYDFVQQRFLVAAISEAQWKANVANLATLISMRVLFVISIILIHTPGPGGWIQLLELDLLVDDNMVKTEALHQMQDGMRRAQDLSGRVFRSKDINLRPTWLRSSHFTGSQTISRTTLLSPASKIFLCGFSPEFIWRSFS